jgi:hypothetical protein
MSPLALNLILLGLCLLVLLCGFKWGAVAVHSLTVERSKEPVTFWLVMTMAFLGVLASIGLMIAGR